MPNIKSAKKRVKIAETKALQNQMFKTSLKTMMKKYQAAVVAGDKDLASQTYKSAVKIIDKAVAKGILHKNNAARKKSRFTVMLSNMNA